MIVADTKDWTWVLERPCVACGFDSCSWVAAAVPGLIRDNILAWRRLLDQGGIRPGRPDDATWSTLEYACHLRDVYRRYEARVDLMLTEDDPLFPNWDQDASAVTDRYEARTRRRSSTSSSRPRWTTRCSSFDLPLQVGAGTGGEGPQPA